MIKQRSVVESFNSAIEGFLYVIKTQKNMRFHFLAGVSVLIVAIYLHVSLTHTAILCCVISLVFILEMVNTAVEHTIDLVVKTYSPLARAAKDIMAGAVLLAAINACVVGYLIFQQRLGLLDISVGMLQIRQSSWHMTFIATILVMAVAVALKLAFQKGTPFRGGMPSGHAAFVFSAWTIITFLTQESLVVILTLIMAILVARSRVKEHIHTVWEVIVGALLGVMLTTLVFQLVW